MLCPIKKIYKTYVNNCYPYNRKKVEKLVTLLYFLKNNISQEIFNGIMLSKVSFNMATSKISISHCTIFINHKSGLGLIYGDSGR